MTRSWNDSNRIGNNVRETNLGACDYYLGIGVCAFGCHQEPECQTGEPKGGWPPIRRAPYAEFLLAARRQQHRQSTFIRWRLAFPHLIRVPR